MQDPTEMHSHYAVAARGGNALNAVGALVIYGLLAAWSWGDARAMAWVLGMAAVRLPVNVWISHKLVARGFRQAELIRLVFSAAGIAIVGHALGWILPVWLFLPFMALALDDFGGTVLWWSLAGMFAVADALALVDGASWVYPASFTLLAIFCRLVVSARSRIVRRMFLDSENQRRSLAEAQARLQAEMIARERAEVDLRAAQRLQAVGRLAAGVAHEINSPLQSALLSTEFLGECVGDLKAYAEEARPEARLSSTFVGEAQEAATLAIEGMKRVASIVQGLRQFAGPETVEKSAVDVNRLVEATLAVGAHEYKYVAELHTDLGDIPAVIGHAGELGQLILNLIVNAAHAIASAHADAGARGRIEVRTRLEGAHVLLSVGDDGAGIPDDVRSKVFDLFFTTKELGKGTGQGLSISRTIVVDRHGGSIDFDTRVGAGTTFFVRLPVAPRSIALRSAA